jgi:hypothetical protein
MEEDDGRVLQAATKKERAMNEQLEKFRKLAMEEYVYTDVDGDNNHGVRLNEEKFAELIVRECSNIFVKIENGNLHLGTDNYLEAIHAHFRIDK